MKLQRILFLSVLLLVSTVSYSQQSCLNTLREAKDLYEQGLIDEIPTLMASCMESGFTRTQRIEAYKLIILSYLFDDDQFAAEKMMDQFLRKFPEYEVMPNDPVEFVYLLESYKTSSFYSFNVTFGPTFTNPVILESFSALDRNNTEYTNKTGAGFHFGLGISRNLIKSVNANIGVFFSTYRYSFHEVTTTWLGDEELTFATIDSEEELRRVDVPLTITYSFGRGNLKYAIRAGGLVGFVNQAKMSPSRNHPYLINKISDSGIDIREYRNSMDYGAVMGFGLEYKIPRGNLVLEGRYNMGLRSMVISDEHPTSSQLYNKYYHIDNDFSLNGFILSFGYHFSIYQSKKNRF